MYLGVLSTSFSFPPTLPFRPALLQGPGLGLCFHLALMLGDLSLSRYQASDFAPSAWVASLQLSPIPASPVGSSEVTQHVENGAVPPSSLFDSTTNISDTQVPVTSEGYQY